MSWDRKLDGRLAGMLMSIPAVKAVEIGLGVEAARRPGSAVHDPIDAAASGASARAPATARAGFRRRTNNAGGLEGGITTGEPLVIRVAMKPISHADVAAAHRGSRHRRGRPTPRASART